MHEMKIEEQYINYKKQDCGARTIMEIRRIFNEFFSVTGSRILDAEEEQFFLYCNEKENHWSPSTLRRAKIYIRDHLRWGERNNFSPKINPSDIKTKKVYGTPHAPVSFSQHQILMEYYRNYKNKEIGLRMRAILSILWDTGIRIGELPQIEKDAVQKSFIDTSKYGEDRWVFWSEETQRIIEEYLKVRPESESEKLVVVRVRGKVQPIGAPSISSRVCVLSKALGLGVKLHGYRHAKAMRMLHAGANLEDIRYTLGHTDISTTQLYLKLPTVEREERAHLFMQAQDIDWGIKLKNVSSVA